MIQCIGDGTDTAEISVIDEAEVLEEAGIADMRFAMFSSLGLALQEDTATACTAYQKELKELQKKGKR